MANINTLSFMSLLNFIAVVLALMVSVLVAYTRLTDSGLGCPDWPGIAVAHNAVAALSLLTIITLNYIIYAQPISRFN